jgi:Type ISP C-terminal specificity domain
MAESKYDQAKIVRYPFKPFDVRNCYLDNIRPLFSEPSPDLLAHRSTQNWFLISRDTADKAPEGPPFFASKMVCDYDFISGHARHFPILTYDSQRRASAEQHALDFAKAPSCRANLSRQAREYLRRVGYADPDKIFSIAEVIWLHALAIGFSRRYLTENADGVAIDWPRIPLPDTRNMLDSSAALGRRLAALLDTERDVVEVTTGNLAEHYRVLGGISASDLKVNAGWGRADKKGSVYPGTGKIVARNWSGGECGALKAGFDAAKIPEVRGFELLGRPIDVYLNGTTHWRAVPEQVWEFYIGGYQVVKKWLSYREEPLIGRPLTKDEAREVTGMVRRLAAIVLMTDELDANYVAVREHTYSWPNHT